MDNTSSNNTLIWWLEQHVDYMGNLHHVRCFVHIINLSACAALKPFETPSPNLTDVSEGNTVTATLLSLQDEHEDSDNDGSGLYGPVPEEGVPLQHNNPIKSTIQKAGKPLYMNRCL